MYAVTGEDPKSEPMEIPKASIIYAIAEPSKSSHIGGQQTTPVFLPFSNIDSDGGVSKSVSIPWVRSSITPANEAIEYRVPVQSS
jgi:hypothetical protein